MGKVFSPHKKSIHNTVQYLPQIVALNPKHKIATILKEFLPEDKSFYQLLQLLNLDTKILHKYPTEISGGEKQRVALIRALIFRPSLLILDEPTASLDHDNALSLIKLLKCVQKSYPLYYFIITHNIALFNEIDGLTINMEHCPSSQKTILKFLDQK